MLIRVGKIYFLEDFGHTDLKDTTGRGGPYARPRPEWQTISNVTYIADVYSLPFGGRTATGAAPAKYWTTVWKRSWGLTVNQKLTWVANSTVNGRIYVPAIT